MKRVLFVDDEDSVLCGLRRMLRHQRDRFESSFALGGNNALAMMAEEPFDVVVSDMRMPGMSGVDLLEVVRARYPGTVRIALSGQIDEGTSVRLAVLAHQFLTKPCEVDALVEAIDRATT